MEIQFDLFLKQSGTLISQLMFCKIRVVLCLRCRFCELRQPSVVPGSHPVHERVPDRSEEAEGAAEAFKDGQQTLLEPSVRTEGLKQSGSLSPHCLTLFPVWVCMKWTFDLHVQIVCLCCGSLTSVVKCVHYKPPSVLKLPASRKLKRLSSIRIQTLSPDLWQQVQPWAQSVGWDPSLELFSGSRDVW